MANLLLVAAESQRRLDVWDRLAEAGHRVELASEAREAPEAEGTLDLVVLDLQGRGGHRACQEMRQRGFEGVIIMIVDPQSAPERILGLKVGADDVLERPFEMVELLARVEACLRRRPAGMSGVP